MKTIVTHLSVDLDAIASCWLIKRFYPGWENADIAFVPAGQTYQGQPPDINSNIIHVDTGLGKFDHHQNNEYTSAAKKVFDFLVKEQYIEKRKIEPLERLANCVTDSDHFRELEIPDASSDQFDFLLSYIIEGLKNPLKEDIKVSNYVFVILDALYAQFLQKVLAEAEIKKGLVLTTHWGKSIVLASKNESCVREALRMGYQFVARKDPSSGFIRVKTQPKKELDLTPLYQQFLKVDPKATWFLHASKHMLLNGSSKNPTAVPAKISLQRLIEIIKEI